MPAVVSGTTTYRVLYLDGFAVGSTLAMAGLTAALAALSPARRIPTAFGAYVPRVASAFSVVLGCGWLLGSV